MKPKIKLIFLMLTVVVFVDKKSFSQDFTDSISYFQSIKSNIESPVKLCFDSENNIYATDITHKSIHVFDSNNNLIEDIFISGSPVSVAIDENDNLFVGNSLNGNIIKINKQKVETVFYAENIFPASMCFGKEGLLYVVDNLNKEIIVLDKEGNKINSFGRGTLIFPSSIAYNFFENQVIVGEHGGVGTSFTPKCKVWIFNEDGTLYKSFGSAGNLDGQFYRIDGIAVSRCGEIYVSDSYLARISIFDSEGVFLTKFGTFGSDDSQLDMPMDIGFNSNEKIFISSLNNSSIEIFQIKHQLPTSKILTSKQTICNTDNAEIQIELSGSAPWNLEYTVDGINPQIISNINENPYKLIVSEPGLYEVTSLSDAENIGKCFSGSSLITVNSEIPTSEIITQNTILCKGQNVPLEINFTGQAPWSFTYSIDNNEYYYVDNVYNPNFFLDVSKAGEYKITSLNGGSCNGTVFTGSSMVTEIEKPEIYLGEDISFCSGDSRIINAPEGFVSYFWNTNITENYIEVSQNGEYILTVEDENNCFNSDTINVKVNDLPIAFMTDIDSWLCPGEIINREINLSGNAPWNISYLKNENEIIEISNINENKFNLIFDDSQIIELKSVSDKYCNGVEFSGFVKIVNEYLPKAEFSYQSNSQIVNFTNLSTDAGVFYWDFGDNTTSNEANPVHEYSIPGEYIVTLKSENEMCAGTDSISVKIPVGISTETKKIIENEINIYPNPTAGVFNLELYNSNSNVLKIDIFDISGKRIFSQIKNEVFIKLPIDLRNFQNGLYFCKIISNEINICSKIVLNK
jgi:PKD repeat protein/sugar lactone lactonase YvrE